MARVNARKSEDRKQRGGKFSSSPGDATSEAIREGMERRRAVDRYLLALHEHRPRRGRKRSPQRMQARLDEIEALLPTTVSGLARVRLLQEQTNLRRELAAAEPGPDFADLERDFVIHAKAVADREGIQYSTWIACGVPPEVLARAGITPSGRRRSAATHGSTKSSPRGR